ncbi:MAG: RNA polymerase sigma factor [Jhaorihella sp.]
MNPKMTGDEPGAELVALLPLLRRRARRLLRCPDAAADLAQEVALRLWAARAGGAAIEDTQAYAMTVLRNLAVSHWRAARSCEELHEDMAAIAPDALRRIALRDLDRAVSRLSGDHARLIRLVRAGITSPAELACRTGLPVGTVMSRLSRARAALRAELGLDRNAPSASLLDEASN